MYASFQLIEEYIKMLFIPISINHYISSIVALNIHSPNGIGDWHSASTLNDTIPLSFIFMGDGCQHNTLPFLGNIGIIDGTSRLNEMGYFPENAPVWIADHPVSFSIHNYPFFNETVEI